MRILVADDDPVIGLGLAERLRSLGHEPIGPAADGAQAMSLAKATLPDLYLFDSDFKLVYRGQYDSSRPNSGTPVTGEDLRAAIDAVLAGSPVSKNQQPSIGCNIKWKE